MKLWQCVLFVVVCNLIGCLASPEPTSCLAGTWRSCICADQRLGHQACSASGMAYEACDCRPVVDRCGDQQCTVAESCETCPEDCGACLCSPCTQDSDCREGLFCASRQCDGRKACYSMVAGSSCPTVGGLTCPRTSVYERCQQDQDCGPLASCQPLYQGLRICRPSCVRHTDCPAGTSGNALPFCSAQEGLCLLVCPTLATVCPTGMQCTAYPDGVSGYCS